MSIFDQFVLKPDPKRAKPNEAKIFIDTREGGSVQYFATSLMKNYERENIFVEQLSVGDFEIQSSKGDYQVLIERKSAQDFVSSWYDGRLESQVPELAEYDDSILLVHDNLYNPEIWKNEMGSFRRNFKFPDSIDKILFSMAFRKNDMGGRPALIQVNSIRSVPVGLDYVARLIEDDRLIRHRNPMKKNSKKFSNITDPVVHRNVILNRLASVPKMGRKKAEAVLNHFGWQEINIIEASIDEIMAVDKIGKTLATRIKETTHSERYSA